MDVLGFFFQESPKITKYLSVVLISISVMTWLEAISRYYLYLNFSLVFKKFQIWRLFTNFLFFEDFGFSFIFHLFMFYRYSLMLEKSVFKGSSPDYLFFLITLIVCLLLLSPFFGVVYLSHGLCFAMMYYWGRKRKNVMIQFIGIITFRAPYLPWVYLFFSVLLESEFKNDLIGILAGHTIFYFRDIMPRIGELKGFRLLKTPDFIRKLCDKLNLNNEYIINDDDEVLMF